MKKKMVIVFIVVLFLGGVGIGGYWYFFGNKNKTEEIAVGKNQSLIVAQISSINGNEITYAIAEETDFSEIGNGQKGNSSMEEEKDNQNNANEKDFSGNENFGGRQNISEGEIPSDVRDQNMQGGEMPNGMRGRNMSEEEMPSGMGDQNMPDDMGSGKMSARSDTPEDSSSERGNKGLGEERENSQRNKTMYTLTGEEETTLIPVGTTVTTQLGTTTTFSRLAAGDMVKIMMEKDENGKDVIVGIWMVE